jgi:hypothetical protein
VATLWISYDLRGKDEKSEDYEKLIEQIKTHPWAHPTYSDWIVETTKTPEQVRDELVGFIDKDDRLLVATVKAPAAWRGLPKDVSDWIMENLK